jgi:hypothetical protein
MNTQQKPTLINVIAWMTLASGIVNLFWGFAASTTALATILCAICVPITILPAILGIFELIYAAKLFSNPPQAMRPSTRIAVFEIATILIGNVFSMAVGILALVFYNDADVKEYFARLNGTLVPSEVETPKPAPAPAPASLPAPEPVPVVEEPVAPLTEEAPVVPPLAEEEPTPPVEETPAKPKRAPRKVAKKK